MLSTIDIENTKRDVIKATTTLIISHILRSQYFKTEMFSQAWLYQSLATIIGFTLHGLYISRFNKLKVFSNFNKYQKAALKDVIKFGSVFVIQHIALALITTGNVDFSMSWIKTHTLLILGYIIFHMVLVNKLPSTEQPILDIAKISSVVLFNDYVEDSTIGPRTIPELVTTYIGLFIYHKYVKNMTFN